ncbi:MAG: prolipoprotein diacylglyceryl transferase [Blastocatellia bacterium]|nr:prolipoprotein diacylglyceryl transferase [Blastocatellia bacterium]
MSNELFLILLATLFGASFTWAFKTLPQENWQIIASVPKTKDAEGRWRGLNLTYYGFFQATSSTLGVVMMLILLGAIGVPWWETFILLIAIFAICWPSSRLIARLVEKKQHTFTIGGALFAGTIVAPWIIQLINLGIADAFGKRLPVTPALAAAATAYAYGEGFGRLSCISFGCCYGKKVEQLAKPLRRIFESANFVFAGSTKKVAYEGNMEGMQVVPVQAMTAVIYTVTALAGTYLYLKSYFVTSLMLVMITTQVWRILSEILRADFRGKANFFSAYQLMAILIIVYLFVIVMVFAGAAPGADLMAGFNSLWNPLILLLCQANWLTIFLITGRSMVTGSTLTFFVHRDRI